MSLNLTITKAIGIAGSQEKLAALIGENQANISAFKRGKRAIGYKKRAQIASIAGESETRAVMEAIAESLSDDIPHEREAKKGIVAILNAFPQT